jgi:hypothetical protein
VYLKYSHLLLNCMAACAVIMCTGKSKYIPQRGKDNFSCVLVTEFVPLGFNSACPHTDVCPARIFTGFFFFFKKTEKHKYQYTLTQKSNDSMTSFTRAYYVIWTRRVIGSYRFGSAVAVLNLCRDPLDFNKTLSCCQLFKFLIIWGKTTK